ncbi:glypican-3 [Osmerus mordax]|uniref:glypican-3 n=1 Tax=Osmerus mordax TaxID=8014 RepID=UPI00350ECC20
MVGVSLSGALFPCLLYLLSPVPGGQVAVPSCHEVRASFQSLHPGSKWAPETPVSGADLQVCQPRGLSCCSKRMEERYQVAARQNMEAGLQAASAQLKLLIIHNAALFQEAFELVLRHGRNSTVLMLRAEFPVMGGGGQTAVDHLLQDVSLYMLGSDSSVDHMVTTFFTRLFPLAYLRLLGGSVTSMSDECLRGAWKESGAFAHYPKLMMTRLSRSLLATRVFLQALNLGIEVVNTTDHLRPGRDCGRALLRLWYCPHCQGLLAPPACRGFCQAVMQGCLGGAAEVQPHWRAYVEGLGRLAGGMSREQDMEDVVLRLHSLVRLGLRHAVNARSRLLALVSSMCGQSPQRVSRSVVPPADQPPGAPAPRHTQPAPFHPDTLAGHRREFISSLRAFSSFYSGLGETLCSHEPETLNHSLCWNGQEMTDRFPAPGLKRPHTHGPDSKNKPPEPVISQIIDKLKHINQLLRLVTVPEKRWRARSGGGGADGRNEEDEEEGLVSGDCDDEDECTGVSGLGPPPKRKRLRIFADLADSLDDFTFHEQLLTPRLATDGAGATSSGPSQGWSYLVAVLSLPLPLLLLGLH